MRSKRCLPLLMLAFLSACGNSASTQTTPGAPAPHISGSATSMQANASAGQTPMVVYGAGTLALPFREMSAAFEKLHPEAAVQGQFGGSVKMVKQVT